MKQLRMIICSLMLICPLTIVHAEEVRNDLTPQASSAILIEQDTGKILYEKNSHESLPPASMTKIMTMLLIMEKIQNGELKLDEKVRASEYAASMGGSQIFLENGEEMTVEELLKGIAVASGNDASVAMAERVSGSEESFVNLMNKKVNQLKLEDTKFQNPTGLPDKEHYSSAYDMAMLSRELLKYPLITKFTGTYEGYLRANTDKQFWLVNTNKLVKFYPGADGLKTGFTAEAKYCLTATATRNGMRVIGVIMGAPTSKERNAQMSKLLDYAFGNYYKKVLYNKNQDIDEAKVSKGSKNKVLLVSENNVSILLKKGEEIPKITQKIELNKAVKAPIKKGDVVGIMKVCDGDKILSTTNLIAKENISEANWWQVFKNTIGSMTKLTN